MKKNINFCVENCLKFSKLKISKSLRLLIINLAVLFFINTPSVHGQWFVRELYCYPVANGCHHTTYDVPAFVNFRVVFTNIFINIYGAGWGSTSATCPNGARVENNIIMDDQFFFVSYDHYTLEMSGFTRILYTVSPGSYQVSPIGNLYYTPAVTLYFPELCTPPPPPPPGGGGCLSGKTIEGKEMKEGDSSNLCSPCEPTQQELDMCYQSGGVYDWASCFCGGSPIVIDVSGNGFNLTNAENGIQFDINGDGNQEQIAWSSANSDDAWLALDRNNNGTIDDGTELFGNSTEQPAPPEGEQKNGFLALAEFDKSANGGNGDGKINRFDAVYDNLRLWQDLNHNGVSETNELKTVTESGLRIIELDYRESRRTDEHGNRFKYRAKVKDAQGSQLGRWAWDVYLVVETTQNNNFNNVKIYR